MYVYKSHKLFHSIIQKATGRVGMPGYTARQPVAKVTPSEVGRVPGQGGQPMTAGVKVHRSNRALSRHVLLRQELLWVRIFYCLKFIAGKLLCHLDP